MSFFSNFDPLHFAICAKNYRESGEIIKNMILGMEWILSFDNSKIYNLFINDRVFDVEKFLSVCEKFCHFKSNKLIKSLFSKKLTTDDINVIKILAPSFNLESFYQNQPKDTNIPYCSFTGIFDFECKDFKGEIEFFTKVRENFEKLLFSFPDKCSICLEDILLCQRPAEFKHKEGETGVPHIFHYECINNVLNESKTCPICREEGQGIDYNYFKGTKL